MSYSDPKEDVISLELTPYGKYLLSTGRLNPVYYAFFDDDVIYDASYTGVTNEAQNNIENRILDETPRFLAQGITTGRETDFIAIKNPKTINNQVIASFDPMKQEIEYLNQFTDTYEIMENASRKQSLGKLNPDTGYAPSWNITFLKTSLASSTDHLTISGALGETIDNIPQLNIDIQPTIKRNSRKYNIQYESDRMFDEPDPTIAPSTQTKDSISFLRYEDGSSIEVLQDFLAIKVEESNTFFEKENFEVEFFKEIKDLFSGENMKIKKQFYKNIDDFLEDALRGTYFIKSYTVEKQFDFLVDDEINPAIMCPLVAKDKTKDFFVTKIFECEDGETDLTKDVPKQNIYADSEAIKGVCE